MFWAKNLGMKYLTDFLHLQVVKTDLMVCRHFWCLSVSLSLCLSVSLSICLFVDLSVPLSLCLSVCLCVCLSFCLSVFLSVFLSVCLSVFLSVCLSVFLSVYLSVFLSVCLSVCLSVFLSVCLSVCLSVSFSNIFLEATTDYKQFFWSFKTKFISLSKLFQLEPLNVDTLGPKKMITINKKHKAERQWDRKTERTSFV